MTHLATSGIDWTFIPSWIVEGFVDYVRYGCTGNIAQWWTFTPINNTSTHGTIRANHGTKCLYPQGNGTASGTPVVIFTCDAANTGTRWYFETNGRIRNVNSGLCLQPQGGSTANNTRLQVVTCGSAASQNWNVRPLDSHDRRCARCALRRTRCGPPMSDRRRA